MNKVKALAILNIISFLIHLMMTYMVQEKMVTDNTVGEVSALYPSLFTPAGFTFAIWGIIYSFLIIFSIFHIVKAYKRDASHQANRDLEAIGPLFIITNLASAAWLIVWTSSHLLFSVLLILVQLGSLILIHARLHIHDTSRNAGSKLATEFPLSIYLGWISLASIANISSYLQSISWNGFGITPHAWLLIMLLIAILLALFMVFGKRNIAFGLVVAWGLYGISFRLDSLETRDNNDAVNLCWAGIAIVLVSCLIQAGRSFYYHSKS